MVLCKKILQHRLNINDINELYCKDYQKMRLAKLNKQFLGKCIHGILITRIVGIITSSQIHANSQLLDGSMHIDICFEVEGIIYMLNEIITDVQIIDINKKTIIGTSQYATTTLPLIPELNIFKLGDITPVIAKKIQYNIYSEKISVSATMFLPLPKMEIPIYIPNGDFHLDAALVDLLKTLEQLSDSFEKISKEQQKIMDFFVKLIYPYKKFISYKNLKLTNNEISQGESKQNESVNLSCSSENILDFSNDELKKLLEKLKHKAFFLPNDNLDAVDIYYVDVDKLTKHNIWKTDNNISFIIMELDYCEIIKVFVAEFIKKHSELLSLIHTYDSTKKLNSSNHIWKLYNSYKI